MLWQQGNVEEALAQYRQVDERYGREVASGVREQVARALLNSCQAHLKQGHVEEALARYRQLIERYGQDDAAKELVALALFNSGALHAQQRRVEEALRHYRHLVDRFDQEDAPRVREQVASALVNIGACFGSRVAPTKG